jgi:hypothetical protein
VPSVESLAAEARFHCCHVPQYVDSVSILLRIGNVGVPIKLLFEAEGMKVTVEVREADGLCQNPMVS